MFLRLRHVLALVLGLLWVGCSFVRDADRFSAGGPDGGSSGGTGGSGGWGNCKAEGQACAKAEDCCFGACAAGTCKCTGQGYACDDNQDCCSNLCSNQVCGPCGDVGAPCGAINDPPCCRGRACFTDDSQNSSCQVFNACTSYQANIEAQDLHQILIGCGEGDAGSDCASWNPEDKPRCYEACVATKLAISPDCASCYANWWLLCLPGLCWDAGACTTTYSQDCADCCNNVCVDLFKHCTGFPSCPAP